MNINWLVDGEIYNLHQRKWSFTFNTKKKALGTCNFGTKIITLSEPLILSNPDMELWDNTLRHEIAHAIDYYIRGKSDHSNDWKNVGKQIGCSVDLLKSSIKVNSVMGKYTLKCNICEHEIQIHRKRKRESACSYCCKKHNNGLYSNDFKLKLIQNY